MLYVAGWTVFRRRDWFENPGRVGYSLMLVGGILIAVAVEWVAANVVGRWAYSSSMPLIPGLAIGLVPVLQMIVLPPAIFYAVAIWAKRRKSYTSNMPAN